MKAKYARLTVMLVFMAGILLGSSGCLRFGGYSIKKNTDGTTSCVVEQHNIDFLGGPIPSDMPPSTPVVQQQVVYAPPQAVYQQQYQPPQIVQRPSQPASYLKVYRDATGKLWTKDPTTGKYIPYEGPTPQ
jgi:hypothetical protein